MRVCPESAPCDWMGSVFGVHIEAARCVLRRTMMMSIRHDTPREGRHRNSTLSPDMHQVTPIDGSPSFSLSASIVHARNALNYGRRFKQFSSAQNVRRRRNDADLPCERYVLLLIRIKDVHSMIMCSLDQEHLECCLWYSSINQPGYLDQLKGGMHSLLRTIRDS